MYDDFKLGYIEALFFADEPEGEYWHIGMLSDEAKKQINDDCHSFFNANFEMIQDNPRQAGIDFWLTRQGHGAGFWDGDWPEHGEALTAASKTFGECYPYLGDDGLIYFM